LLLSLPKLISPFAKYEPFTVALQTIKVCIGSVLFVYHVYKC